MTLPPKIITTERSHYYQSRQGQPIKIIIAHDTERPKDDHSSLSTLVTGDGRQVSIHVLINEDGSSYLLVPDNLAANHAGYGTIKLDGYTYEQDAKYNVNTISLGFELEHTKGSKKPYPENQLLAAGYWINLWRSRYGNLPMFRHADIDPKRKTDPIYLTVATLDEYALKAALIMQEKPTPQQPIKYKTKVPQVVYTYRKLDAPFAIVNNLPFVLDANVIIPIGDITGDWAWIATGIGFIPKQTIVKV